MISHRSKLQNLHGYRLQQFILLILLTEFLIFGLSGVSFSFLKGALFFNYGVDIFFGIFYFSSLPQLIVSYQWLGITADISIIILLLILIKIPKLNKVALGLMFLLLLYYVTLMGYLNHRNYHFGFVIVLFPFLFKSRQSRYFGYEATRYFLLFFYSSAAVFKLYYHSFDHLNHLSTNIAGQYAPYFIEGNLGVRTQFNLFLMSHPAVSYTLMAFGFVAELLAAVGFFTKKYDVLIGLALILFHFANWFVMDLAPFGQLAFISLLFVGRAFGEPNKI